MTQPTFRDVELISAYLDKQLSPADFAHLETRLKTDEQFHQLLDELSQARAILRQLPARRSPRNFTLTPKMAGLKPPVPRTFPIFRLASALAGLLFLFTYAANLSLPAVAAIRAAAPVQGFGRGGGGGGDNSAAQAAPAAPAAMAPQVPLDSLTPTPETATLMGVAPTQSAAENAAPTQSPTDMAAQPGIGAQSKLNPQAGSAQPDLQPQRTPIQLPIPAGLQFGLLALAVVSAVAAYGVRARSDNTWLKARALQPARPSPRQVLILILIALAILALFLSIQWISTTTFYAFTPQTVALGDKALSPVSLGDKALPPLTGADKGGPPVNGAQHLVITPDTGYTLYHSETSGLITAIDFPAHAFSAETAFTYMPGMAENAPPTGVTFAERAFTLITTPDVQLLAPITISLEYNLTDLPPGVDESKLVLYWWSGTEWQDAATTCASTSVYERSADPKRISLTVCKLGSFILYSP